MESVGCSAPGAAAAIARIGPDGVITTEPFRLGRRADTAPSVVFVADGEIMFGDAAERRGIWQPDRLVREVKRRIGDGVPLLVADERFSAEKLYAATVAWVTGLTLGFALGAALVAMVLGLVQSFKRRPSPALIMAYAGFEGLFLGSLSNHVNQYVNGAAMQAVLGTLAVFAGVLFMYKARIIRVNQRFTRFVMAAAIGFMLLMSVNLLFMVFGGGDGLGFRSGGLGILFGIAGIVLGACFLALDFKQVEDGIAYGAPREESWLAAFGLLAWLWSAGARRASIFWRISVHTWWK